jgi:ABC-type transporter Mla subunit MlaD
MRASRKAAGEIFDNPILIGTITILIASVAVYLSYIAENGLPFVPSYNITVDVQSAAQLVKNADVRVGGARVGQVLSIAAEPRDSSWPHPYARLKLQLQKSLEPLPLDSYYLVRTASVLGGKYLEIVPGRQQSPGLPDGGAFHLAAAPLCSPPGGAPPGLASAEPPNCNHDQAIVDLDTAFRTFGPKTTQGLRHTVGALGDAVAGRGTQINSSLYGLRQLIAPLEQVLRTLSSPGTHLSQFISGAAAATGALAPVASTVSSLLSNGATTLAALQNAGPALAATIDQLPATESTGTTVLRNAVPVLTEAASVVNALKPGAALLPLAGQRLDAILLGATPVFKLVPKVASTLQTALASVDKLAKDPAAIETFKVLGVNDLATVGASGFVGLGAILRTIAPAQFGCNIAGIWVANSASWISEGDSAGTWLRVTPLVNLGQMIQNNTPSPDLHANPYPIERPGQCQSGHQTYSPGQAIGNSNPTTGSAVDNTLPPPGVLARGKAAGLVPAG